MRRPASLRSRPPREERVEEAPAEDDPSPIASAHQQVASSIATKAATMVLTAALICGPLALGLSATLLLLGATRPTVTPAGPATDLSRDRAAAAEFAERVVVVWLTTPRGQEDQLDALVAVPDVTLPEVPFKVADAAVSSIEATGGSNWSVTVAATVTDQQKHRGRRFYQLPVAVDPDGTVTALALPAPVTGPPIGADPQLDYRYPVDPTGPVAQTVDQFLGAYLAGQGDVTRYVSPGTQMAPIIPAPYTAVQTTSLVAVTDADTSSQPSDGTRLRVLAAADVTANAKQQQSVTYALSILARAGRWEVQAIDSAPAIATPTSTVPPTADPSTSTPAATGPSDPPTPAVR